MASIEAVYIIDLSGRTILDYPIVSSPPSIESLAALLIDPNQGRIKELAPVVEISSTRVLYHQKHGNLVFLLPCSIEMPPLVPFEFINRFAEVLERYFTAPVIPTKIETNLDTVTLLLNEMLDDGYPYLTEPDNLRDYVPYGGILSKLLSGAKSTPSQSDIAWRRSNVRHTNNELFVDLVETLYVVVAPPRRQVTSSSAFYSSARMSNQAAHILVSRVEGAIFITSLLSGIPEIQLVLNPANTNMDYISFHPCVRLNKWKQSPNTMSFIPPDGKTLLGSYTLNNTGQGLVMAELRTGLGVNKDEFEACVWTVMTRDAKAVEGLSLNIVCGPKAKKVNRLRVTAGDFHMNESGIGEWVFPGKTPLGWSATLRGVLQTSGEIDESENAPVMVPSHITMTYTLTGQVPSGVRVQSLRIVSNRGQGDGVKPFKGVRYTTQVGEYVVR